MAKASSYEEMTTEELEDISQQLWDQAREAKITRRYVNALLENRRTSQAAYDKVAALNSAERKALAQAIQAVGIETGEEFGDLASG